LRAAAPSSQYPCIPSASLYQVLTGVLRAAIVAIARRLNITGASPGGAERHFCEPV
jgi:hypothetical protein